MSEHATPEATGTSLGAAAGVRTGVGGGVPGDGPSLPSLDERWRCGGCGNLTRFDVVREATTREFWHVDLSGQPDVEETETLDQELRSVTCRWCGRDDAIELVSRPGGPPP